MMCRAAKGALSRVVCGFDGTAVEVLCIEVYFAGNKSTEEKKELIGT